MPESTERVDDRWRALWDASPQRSPFSHLDYIRAVAKATRLRLDIHLINEEGDDQAGAAVLWRRRGPYREVIVPPFTPYSAVLLRKGLTDAEVHRRATPLDTLLDLLEKAYDGAQVHLHPALSDVRPAVWRGWNASPLYTYAANLTSAPEFLSGWSSTPANVVRAAGHGFEIVKGDEAADVAARLVQASYERHQRKAPLSLPRLRTLILDVSAAGLCDVFTARYGSTGKPDAAAVVATDEAGAYYWLAGAEPGNASTVLVGHLVTTLYEMGIRQLDFVGANIPSIAEFKRKFGCRLVTYYRITKYRRLSLALLKIVRGRHR